MIDNESFKHDKKLKKYSRGDRSKVDSNFHDKLDIYFQLMGIPVKPMSMIQAIPGYHMWNNTKGSSEEIHSLPLSGNYRLLFCFDEGNDYFYRIEVYDPHS